MLIFFIFKTNIDGNHNTTTKRLNELAEKLANQIKNGSGAINDLANRLVRERERETMGCLLH